MELPFTYQTPDFIQELTKVTFPGQSSHRSTRSSGRPISTTSKTTAVSRNAARERTRVKSLRTAFQNLQRSLPYVPPNTKLSKLDVLILATTYISHLMKILNQESTTAETDYPEFASCHSKDIRSRMWETSYLHPVKKWPMRSRLYAGVQEDDPMNLSMEGYNRAFPTELGRQRRGLSL